MFYFSPIDKETIGLLQSYIDFEGNDQCDLIVEIPKADFFDFLSKYFKLTPKLQLYRDFIEKEGTK